MNPLRELQRYRQSVWMDYIRRDILHNGEMERLIDEDGLRGVTSNPTIFEKAIAESSEYDSELKKLLAEDRHTDAASLYETLTVEDIGRAADLLLPIFQETRGADGYVSIEANPHLANDTSGSIEEARHLWRTVGRPNVMVKIPATPEGIPAVQDLIAEGININITLMFSVAHYEAVANAFLRGIERCPDPTRIASVASVFVSRIDRVVDGELEKTGTPAALALRGKIAIANSKMIYRRFQEIFQGHRFAGLQLRGVRRQRVLWGSTSTKDPAYSDVLYVEELIGPDTVNTMPPATMDAFRDHGHVRGATIQEELDEAARDLEQLKNLGIDLDAITEKLQRDGVASFSASIDKLLASLDKKCHALA